MANVKIVKMRTPKGTGNLKAFFTLSLGVLDIDDMKLVEGSNGLFLGFPSRKYEVAGETKYADIVKLARDANGKYTENAAKLYEDVLVAAIAEYEKIAGKLVTAVEDDENDDLPF